MTAEAGSLVIMRPQWSLARKARKTIRRVGGEHGLMGAAMEPGPEGQEDCTYDEEAGISWVAAMEPGPEGQEDLGPAGLPHPLRRRNGAWPGRPGRLSRHMPDHGLRSGPQWSLARKARKTGVSLRRPGRSTRAAMEPGPEGQEDSDASLQKHSGNGAAAMEPGPEGQEDDTLRGDPQRDGAAAMEPGPEGQEVATRPRRTLTRSSSRNGAWPGRPGRPRCCPSGC